MTETLGRFYRGVVWLEGRALALLMLSMVVLYGFNVGVRSLAPRFASEVAWIDEATRIMLVWAVFLALGLAMERGRHVAMSAIFDRLPQTAQAVIGRVIDIAGFGFALYMAKLGYDIAVFVAGTGQVSPTLGVSMAWLYAVLPVGMVLLALRFAMRFFGLIPRGLQAERPEEHAR